jgi:periplasmic divalent cation tolerance protein
MSHVQIHFAVDDADRADAIVGSLLIRHLVACGQRFSPAVSRYWWEGSVEQAEEWLVVLKTRSVLASRVIDAVVADHPYDTPEVVVLPILMGAPAYLDWIDEVTADALR